MCYGGTTVRARIPSILATIGVALGVLSVVPASTSDAAGASFRARDTALLDTFAGLKDECAPRWAEPECLPRLRHLRAEELQLFAEVRAHRFADLTESNYWHRGRLKFPGEIQQALERTEAGSRNGPRGRSATATPISSTIGK